MLQDQEEIKAEPLVSMITLSIAYSSKPPRKMKFGKNDTVWNVKVKSMAEWKIDVSKAGEYSLLEEGKCLPDKKTLKGLQLQNNAILLLDNIASPTPRMEVYAAVTAVIAPIIVFWIFFWARASLPYVRDVPQVLIIVSLAGVAIYLAIIAATKVQSGSYRPIPYIPEYMLRAAEAPLFMTVIYTTFLQTNANTTSNNQPGTLLVAALFVGLFTRDFEEILKTVGKSVLNTFESYYSRIQQTSSDKK